MAIKPNRAVKQQSINGSSSEVDLCRPSLGGGGGFTLHLEHRSSDLKSSLPVAAHTGGFISCDPARPQTGTFFVAGRPADPQSRAAEAGYQAISSGPLPSACRSYCSGPDQMFWLEDNHRITPHGESTPPPPTSFPVLPPRSCLILAFPPALFSSRPRLLRFPSVFPRLWASPVTLGSKSICATTVCFLFYTLPL